MVSQVTEIQRADVKAPHHELADLEKEDFFKIVKMRQEGLSYQEIQEQMGLPLTTVVKAVVHTLTNWPLESRETLRRLEERRLDWLWEKASGAIRGGNLDMIGNALRVMERRAKLRGLDVVVQEAPPKVNVVLNFAEELPGRSKVVSGMVEASPLRALKEPESSQEDDLDEDEGLPQKDCSIYEQTLKQ